MTEAQDKQERLKGLYKKYALTDEVEGPPLPKKKQKKQKSWIRAALDAFLERFKRKKRSVPKIHEADRGTLQKIMEE